jgi:phage replication-related protein YjqB (UPF0714/DUF867 family)
MRVQKKNFFFLSSQHFSSSSSLHGVKASERNVNDRLAGGKKRKKITNIAMQLSRVIFVIGM